MEKNTISLKIQGSDLVLIYGASSVWNNLGHFSKNNSNLYISIRLLLTNNYIISIPDPRNWQLNIHSLAFTKEVCSLSREYRFILSTTAFLLGIKGWKLHGMSIRVASPSKKSEGQKVKELKDNEKTYFYTFYLVAQKVVGSQLKIKH